jgi:hypothetical protein
MTKEEIFSLWAPDESPWSRWAKPVLFAYLDTAWNVPAPDTVGDVSWTPGPNKKVALVLDLPGAEGVQYGLALAARAYRPVPLYNAIPLPFGEPLIDPVTGREVAAVNVLPIITALRQGADRLIGLNLPFDAPPAFLLDANRSGGGRKMEPDEFDNRSVSFTTDFPSAQFLVSQRIERVMLVQSNTVEPQPDLANSLRRWQDGGLKLERLRLSPPSQPEPFEVARPSWYRAMFQWVFSRIGYQRSSTGGFGGWVPAGG